MNLTHVIPVSGLAILGAAVIAVQTGRDHRRSAGATGTVAQNASNSPANGIGDFHAWRKVNPVPIPISSRFDGLCIGPTPAEVASLAADPHMHKSITVWVNKIGADAMTTGGRFPAGSVIVKEKHVWRYGGVDMSTVMIKRPAGYNPKCGDWEFQTLDASGKVVTSHGRIESCMKCHRDQASLDYTFRTYLPSPRTSTELVFGRAK